jgi:hypothetical protein
VHEIIEGLTDEQLDAVLHDMAADDLWGEASVLLRKVRTPALARVAGRLQIHSVLADQIPPQLIRELATDLFADDQLATMVLFVPVVSAEALTAAIEVAGAVNLLRIAPMITWTPTVVSVLESLPDSYLDAVLGEVAEHDLLAAGEALVEQLDDDLRARIVARLRVAPTELLARIRDAVLSNTSSPVLRQLVAEVDS